MGKVTGRERTLPTLVSVVLPCRNVAETIEDQLRSLSLSDYRGAWEVIVVDNCSTDSTAAQAERWSKHLPLRVISATGAAGINTARNAGAKEARGELLLFCDGDDEVATDWVQTLTTAALGYDLVGGRLDEVRLNRGRGPRRPSHPIGQLPVAGNYLPFEIGRAHV